jgi:uncharacterized protein involved in type VI secretion and phage assembly
MNEGYVDWPEIKINGIAMDQEAFSNAGFVEEVVVDDDLGLPATFTITLHGGESPPYRIGQTVEVMAQGFTSQGPLLTGEITTITGDYDGFGQRIHLRGYDVSHRLHRGRQTRTFVNVTDSDICRKIANDAGIAVGTVDQTDATHDHVSQANQTDWDFLKARAKAIGFLLNVDEGKLNFQRPPDSSGAPDEGNLLERTEYKLVFGQDLLEYRPRITSSGQVARIEVRGWDRQNKRELVGQAAAGTTSAKVANTSPASVAQPFGDHQYVQADHPGASSDEVDTAAAAIAEHIGSAFAEAEGMTRGNGMLRAGVAVNISGVADEFTGRFVLTHTRHVWNRNGYRTHFEISGRQRRSLLGLVAHGGQSFAAATTGQVGTDRVYGVVTAVVTGNDDPLKQGRVKIKMPWLSGDYESTWAAVVQASAGPDSGAVYIPEVGDEVLVAFENGDVARPYVIGGLYNGMDKPKLGDDLFDNGKVKRRGFVSRLGHKLVFFDDDSKSGVALLSADGKLRVALSQSGKELHVFGDPKVVVEAASEIDLRSQGTLNIEAQGKLTIKSSATVDIDGAMIELN